MAKWIQNAIKKPGALRFALHIKSGQAIPEKKLNSTIKKGGKNAKRAQLAKTLKSFHKKGK